jgi:type VI secretion system protein ImpB
MSKKESTQQRLKRIRPPRVQMTYDVETGGAIENKELPFVVGVLGDFTGKPDEKNPLPKVRDRKFVNVDLDNFDAVMEGMKPNASYRVANALSAEGGEFGINVEFSSIEDFSPEAVVQQVEPLRRLLEVRTRLSDLRNKISGNEKLEDVLGQVLSNTEQLKKLGQELATTEE